MELLNIKKILYLNLILFLVSCELKVNSNDDEKYNIKTNEIIDYKLKEFGNFSCIFYDDVEKNKIKSLKVEAKDIDFKSEFMNYLDLKENDLYTMIKMSNNFKFNKKILSKYKIIKKSDIILHNAIINVFNKCKGQYIYISPPLFNKDFTKAIFFTSNNYAPGGICFLELKDDKWIDINNK